MPNDNVRKRPAMEIGISGISEGDHPFSFEVAPQEIGLDESFLGSVVVTGVLRKVSTQFFLQSTVAASMTCQCDRCLRDTRRDVVIPMAIYYRIDADARAVDDGSEEVDVVTLAPDTESIVLDDEVRQVILLDRPLKVLCDEECKGICSGCGADLNNEPCRCAEPPVDPRWSKLAEMLKNKNGGQE